MMTKTQLVVLKNLIASNALTGTDEEICAACNEKTVTSYRGLTSSELNAWAVGFPGTRKTIMQSAADFNDPNYEICAAAKFAMDNTAEPLDMSKESIRTMVSLLPIAEEAKTALISLATVMISIATEAGLPEIKTGYVYAARLLP